MRYGLILDRPCHGPLLQLELATPLAVIIRSQMEQALNIIPSAMASARNYYLNVAITLYAKWTLISDTVRTSSYMIRCVKDY